MKLKQLLILGALLLSGSAYAEVAERQKPAFEGTPIEAFTDGKTSMYMYNVGAKRFFTAGNAWGTQTSIGDTGYRVYFEQYLVDGAWDGTTVYFRDSCLAKSGALKDVFFDTMDGYCYVDRGSQGNYWWKLEKSEGNLTYRLSMAEVNPDYEAWQVYADSVSRTYWGWCDSVNGGENTAVYAFLDSANPHNQIDWQFYSVADHEAYQAKLTVYNAAQNLYSFLKQAWANGVDVAAQDAVYANAASTVEDFDAAVVAVKAALAAYEEASVDPSNPVDKTSLITNPNYDNDSWSGWSGTGAAMGYGTAEFYEKTFDAYQNISGAPKGVYVVSVRSYLRAGWAGDDSYLKYVNNTGHDAWIYAANGVDSVNTAVPSVYVGATTAQVGIGGELEATNTDGETIWIPNNMQAADAYFADAERGPKFEKGVFVGVVDGNLKIGVKQLTYGAGYWFEMDNWKLTYYGNKPEAYQMWLADALKNAPQFGEDVVATVGMIEDYNNTIAGLTGSNYEEVSAAIAAMQTAAVAVEANVAAWKSYQDSIAIGLEMAASGTYIGEAVDLLNDYCEFDSEDILAEMTLTTEELKEELAKLNQLIKNAMGSVKEGDEITKTYLVNPDFSQGSGNNPANVPGWNGNWTNVSSQCMEGYGITFNAWQEVKNAPVGLYEVSLQGFYRILRDQTAYDMYLNGEQTCPASVYVNNNESGVKCVFDEPELCGNVYTAGEAWADADSLNWYPNTMKSAGEAFTAGKYVASASGVVAREGDSFVLGVKGALPTDTWAIWDNFRLYYWGFNATRMLPHLQTAIEAGKANLEKSITKDVYELVNAAIAEGETAAAGTDGKVMFNALVKLYDSNDSVNAVAAILEATLTEAEDLFQAAASAVTAPESVVAEAYLLAGEVMDAIDARELTTQAAEDYRKKMNLMLITLRLPDTAGASDDNAIDVTSVLDNPDFGDMLGVNTVDGWDGATGSFGNDDTQKATMAYEYYQKAFDMSQTVIGGLPNGTYRVEVQAFGRLGGSQDDFDAFIHNPDTMSAARPIIYAYSTTDSLATYKAAPVNLYGSAALTEDLAGEGTASLTDANGNTFYTPNSMVSTSVWFNAGYYNNVLYVDVTDGTLCLGMKKEAYNTNDWVMMDSWKLFYLGTNSAYDIQDVVAADGQVVSVSVYGANGAQLNGMKKGLNIIRTVYANGAVKVKKVMVK